MSMLALVVRRPALATIPAAGWVSLAILLSVTVGCGAARLSPPDKPAAVPLLAFANWDGEIDVISASGSRLATLEPPQARGSERSERNYYRAASIPPGTRACIAVRCRIRWDKLTGEGPPRGCVVVRREIDAPADLELFDPPGEVPLGSPECVSAQGPCAVMAGRDVVVFDPTARAELFRWKDVFRWSEADTSPRRESYIRWAPDSTKVYALITTDCDHLPIKEMLAGVRCDNAASLTGRGEEIRRFKVRYQPALGGLVMLPPPGEPGCDPSEFCDGPDPEVVRSLFGSGRHPVWSPIQLPNGPGYCYEFEKGLLSWKRGVACFDPATERTITLEILERGLMVM